MLPSSQVGGLHSEIEKARSSIRELRSEWYSDLVANLRKLNQIAEYLLNYLVTTVDEPSKENLLYIHAELSFAWQVIKEDIIELQSALIKKHPGWKAGVNVAKTLYGTDLLNAIHSLRDYIQLYERAADSTTKSASDAQKHIKSFSGQRRTATKAIMIYKDKFGNLIKSIDIPRKRNN